MKRLLVVLTTGLLFISINNGCDIFTGPVDVQISISVEPEVVPYNGSAIASWNVSGGSYVRIGDLGPYELNHQITIDKIRETESYSLNVFDKNDNLIETKIFTIPSGDWTSSTFGLLTYGQFIRKEVALNCKITDYKWYKYQDNSVYYNAIYDFKEDTYTITFTDDVIVTHGYSLVEVNDSLKIRTAYSDNKYDLFIVKLDIDSLILQVNTTYSEDTDGNGSFDLEEPSFVKYYFVRDI